MDMFFEPYQTESCCLCGSRESLTGEHKIKASVLRKIFSENAMVIGNFDGENAPRLAQGPKSRAFHFSARMCSLCNNTLTQAADHEFDRFHALADSLLSEGKDPSLAFDSPKYILGSEAYLNVFRYFSKMLCCHIAESSGPRLLAACEFAMGKTNRNIVFLHIDIDLAYEVFRDKFGEHQFARHGGLMVLFDPKTQNLTSFRSSISLGAVRYTFWVEINETVAITLRTFHYEFWRKCKDAYLDALKNPLPSEQ